MTYIFNKDSDTEEIPSWLVENSDNTFTVDSPHFNEERTLKRR